MTPLHEQFEEIALGIIKKGYDQNVPPIWYVTAFMDLVRTAEAEIREEERRKVAEWAKSVTIQPRFLRYGIEQENIGWNKALSELLSFLTSSKDEK